MHEKPNKFLQSKETNRVETGALERTRNWMIKCFMFLGTKGIQEGVTIACKPRCKDINIVYKSHELPPQE